MVKYYYNKYTAIPTTLWNDVAPYEDFNGGNQYSRSFGPLYVGFWYDRNTNRYNLSGQTYSQRGHVNPNDVGYEIAPGGDVLYRYVAQQTSNDPDGRQVAVIASTKTASKNTSTTTYSQGSLVQSNIVAENGTYPTNGRHSDGYWYVRGAVANTAPTMPGTFTQPVGVLIGGANITATWGASTDAEGNLITYYPEYRYYKNGVAQPWVSLANNNSLTRSLTLSTDKTMDKIEFRVRAFDGTDYSSYRNSSVYTIGHNTTPTLTLNTANNLTLSEAVGQNEILVEGSALDADPNNTVTIKAQFNNGTVRNLNSAISNGTTPIPFSKLFTYKDKQVFDGDTPLTVELAENVDHTLKVWAEDGQGGISTIAERKFRVIHNRPPVITDTDRDLGTLIESPSITYQVNDLEGQAITVTEKVNGQVIRTFEAEPNTDYTLEIPLEMWIPLQLHQHSLTIEAADAIGAKSTRTFTFTRNEETILLELKNPFVTDIAASRILVTPDVYVPIGSTIKIEACNNAFDSEPTWEDITGMAMNKRGYTFTNTEKTAEEWGINIRFTLEKGTASQQVRLEGFGGAFD